MKEYCEHKSLIIQILWRLHGNYCLKSTLKSLLLNAMYVPGPPLFPLPWETPRLNILISFLVIHHIKNLTHVSGVNHYHHGE